jgi:hypothetical protein
MDPNEIIKAVPEIAKVAGPLAAAIPFTGIVKRMLGPASDEVAEMWRDQIRVYRYGRQLKLLEKAERMAQEAGFTPQAVPPKILFPLLEGASMEEDEDLHTMWAALLANAASHEHLQKIRPGFIAILRQMAPDESALLNWMYDALESQPIVADSDLMRTYASLGFGPRDEANKQKQIVESQSFLERYLPCRDNLSAQELIRHRSDHVDDTALFSLTGLGTTFVRACRPPKRQENG